MPIPTDTLILPACPAAKRVLGQYVLVREAGRGGMSVVHEARDARTGRSVAVKVLALPTGLPTMQSREMQARFTREAHAVVGLSHPNIVSIFELGEHEGQQFLVMEFLHGETLHQRLVHDPLTPVQALLVLRQVADAVDAIHALGIVHRDIKPSNVMLMRDGTAKLLDFGIARQDEDATITSAGMLVGSPAYMAPEQVRGESATPASDVWALGALLYEMLAGRPPFTGKNIPAVLYQVSHENPPPVVGLTGGVQRVLRCALHKNPARRYRTARAFAESLASALSPAYSRRPWRPRQWAVLTGSVVATLGLGVLALRLGRPLAGGLPPRDIVSAADVSHGSPRWEDAALAVPSPVMASGPVMAWGRPRSMGVLRHKAHRRHPAHRTRKAHRTVSQKHFSVHRSPRQHAATARRITRRTLLTPHPLSRHAVDRRLAVRHTRPANLQRPVSARFEPRVPVDRRLPVDRQRPTLRLSTAIKRPLRAVVFRHPIADVPRRLGIVVWHRETLKPIETDPPRTRRSPDKPFDAAESARLQKYVWSVGR